MINIDFLLPQRTKEIPDCAKDKFKEYFIQSDRVMLLLLLVQWIISTFITSISYNTYIYGFVGGGIITLSLFVAYRFFKGTSLMRILVALGMVMFSLIYIQQQLGRIEMHFHIFIILAILFY